MANRTTQTLITVLILSTLYRGVNTENNFSPQFDYFPSSIYIPESVTYGDVIWSCNATDGDDPTTPAGQFRYGFNIVLNYPKWFLDSRYCKLYHITLLDYERQTDYYTDIIVKDLDPISPKTTTSRLNIYITDTNDNIPICEEYSSVLDVPEDQQVNTEIAKPNCADEDRIKTTNGKILFKISDSNSAEVKETFKVDTGDGIVTLKKQLDYETVKFYKLTIDVYDNAGSESLTTTVTYNIQVGDIDDNKPTWSQNPLTVYVRETAIKLGDVAFTVTANDVDKPLTTASTITYGIKTPPVTDWFHIDSHTGAVYVKGILNCNTASLVTMEVYAYSSNTTTDISVLLVNIRITECTTTTFRFNTVTDTISTSTSMVTFYTSYPQPSIDTEKPRAGGKPRGGADDEFIKGLGIGIGSTLAVVIVCILAVVLVYKYRHRKPTQRNGTERTSRMDAQADDRAETEDNHYEELSAINLSQRNSSRRSHKS